MIGIDYLFIFLQKVWVKQNRCGLNEIGVEGDGDPWGCGEGTYQ